VFCLPAAYLFETLGDTKGIYSQALIPFQPEMRCTREKTPMIADARHDVAGRLQPLRNCWTVLPSAAILCHV
jgi:hypothetical protein